MKTRFACMLAGALLALSLFGHPAGAQTPSPSATAAPTPVAFTAHAHANVTVTAQNRTYGGTAQLALAQSASLTRIDVLSVQSDVLPIPAISLTVVVDRGANTITGWSDTTKRYYVQSFLPRPAASSTPNPSATPRPPQRGASPFSKLDVFEVSMKLTGHVVTAGVATTGLSFDMQVRNKGDKAVSHVTAATQLADEFAAFPMTLELSVEPGAAPFGAKLAYVVDDLAHALPPATRFDIPAGYTKVPSFMAVIFSGGRGGAPSPVPAPH